MYEAMLLIWNSQGLKNSLKLETKAWAQKRALSAKSFG